MEVWDLLQQKIADVVAFQKEKPRIFYERIASVDKKWTRWNYVLSLSRWDMEQDLRQALDDVENLYETLVDEFTIVF